MTGPRTDIHRPSAPEFDPEAYTCYGVWDMNPEWPQPELSRQRAEIVLELRDRGFVAGPGHTTQCGHCGAGLRYAALMVHEAAKQYIYVGEQCLIGRFDALTKAEFQQLRETARLNREQATRQERIDAFVQVHPEARVILDYAGDNTFVSDVQYKLRRYAELSDRQVEAAVRAITRDAEREQRTAVREAEKEQLRESGVTAPSGKQLVEGVVVTLKEKDGYMPGTVSWKMVVKTDAGWSVWVSVPAALEQAVNWNVDDLRGKRVRFSATLEVSGDDPLFAFAKRPTKAEVL